MQSVVSTSWIDVLPFCRYHCCSGLLLRVWLEVRRLASVSTISPVYYNSQVIEYVHNQSSPRLDRRLGLNDESGVDIRCHVHLAVARWGRHLGEAHCDECKGEKRCVKHPDCLEKI